MYTLNASQIKMSPKRTRVCNKPGTARKQISDDVAGLLFFKSGTFFAVANGSLRYASAPDTKTGRHI